MHILPWFRLLVVISPPGDLAYDTHSLMGNSALPGRRLWGGDLRWKSSGLSACDCPSHSGRASPPSGWDLCERHSEHGRFIKWPSGTARQMKSPHATVHLSSEWNFNEPQKRAVGMHVQSFVEIMLFRRRSGSSTAWWTKVKFITLEHKQKYMYFFWLKGRNLNIKTV